jgi:chromosome segregation ATPase
MIKMSCAILLLFILLISYGNAMNQDTRHKQEIQKKEAAIRKLDVQIQNLTNSNNQFERENNELYNAYKILERELGTCKQNNQNLMRNSQNEKKIHEDLKKREREVNKRCENIPEKTNQIIRDLQAENALLKRNAQKLNEDFKIRFSTQSELQLKRAQYSQLQETVNFNMQQFRQMENVNSQLQQERLSLARQLATSNVEITRVKAENTRVNSENTRVNAENTRLNRINENWRLYGRENAEEENPVVQENNEENRNLCAICTVEDSTHQIVPCGHKCYCRECVALPYVQNLEHCPLCNGSQQRIVEIANAVENAEQPDFGNCMWCQENPITHKIAPCNHRAYCRQCVETLVIPNVHHHERCPTCSQDIGNIIEI